MTVSISDMILIALFIEAIVNALKPIWEEGGQKLTASEYVAMGLGVIFAMCCKLNLLSGVVETDYPAWMNYVFYALTGIAIGRGTNFLYDLWDKLKAWKSGKLEAGGEVQEALPLEFEELFPQAEEPEDEEQERGED